MNALNQLSTLPERKEQIKTFANAGIQEILDGNYSALEFKMRADFIRKALDEIENYKRFIGFNEKMESVYEYPIKDQILLEGKKYEGQDFFGCEIKSQSRKTYDFKACNDEKLNNYVFELTLLKDAIKDREAFLKALPAQMADTETGDIINPPNFTQTEFLVIK